MKSFDFLGIRTARRTRKMQETPVAVRTLSAEIPVILIAMYIYNIQNQIRYIPLRMLDCIDIYLYIYYICCGKICIYEEPDLREDRNADGLTSDRLVWQQK